MCYGKTVTASHRYGKEVTMDDIISFILTVMAGVVCHCINKWLDGDK